MHRHGLGVESLRADMRWIVTPWYFRMLQQVSCVQVPHDQKTAIHESEPFSALASYHNQSCAGVAIHDRAP